MMTNMSTEITMPRSGSGKIGGRLRKAIELMVREGHRRDDAAKLVGMLPKSLYNAFRKHHVRQFYNLELGVLRESGRAKIHHRLEELALQDDHKAAAVKACQVLIADEEESRHGRGIVTQPGLTIVIQQSAAPREPTTIDVTAIPVPIEADAPASEPIFQHPLRRW
jgi:hypothetical protein